MAVKGDRVELDIAMQEQLVRGLHDPAAYEHPVDVVRHIETHISHVLLSGMFAYKIKKPLNLSFLDFSSLEKRRHFCFEELRLNGRLAPHIYLEVVPITGTLDRPRMGGEGEAVDYAVKMRRFPQEALLDGRTLDTELIDRIAGVVAAFHGRIPAVAPEAPYGSPDLVVEPMRENFRQIRRLDHDALDLRRLSQIEGWTETRFSHLRELLAERREQGWVRECHGDMHLGNMALVDDHIVIFDGIEFNLALRWIDTMSEVAFLVMDLRHAGRPRLARRLLDRYLQATGDFGGLRVLRFYQVYRAMVRAKVTAIRLAQSDLEPEKREGVQQEYHSYLDLAEDFVSPPRPALVITCGVSGSGKSTLAEMLCEDLPGVRLRSDVERKRMFSLEAGAWTGSGQDQGIYTPAATEATYRRLLELAETVVSAGETAIVDATFLTRAQRTPFRELAEKRGIPFLILLAEASEGVLRERVENRLSRGQDPSEASSAVLRAQLARLEPPDRAERARTRCLNTERPVASDRLLAVCGAALAEQAGH